MLGKWSYVIFDEAKRAARQHVKGKERSGEAENEQRRVSWLIIRVGMSPVQLWLSASGGEFGFVPQCSAEELAGRTSRGSQLKWTD